MNYAKHARELIDSSKAWLASAELDTDERKWKKANVALAKDYLRLRAANAKLRGALQSIVANGGDDTCPSGCDCHLIAGEALAETT